MNRNGLYVLIGILLAAVIGLGIYLYQQQQQSAGIEIRVDETGLTVDGNS